MAETIIMPETHKQAPRDMQPIDVDRFCELFVCPDTGERLEALRVNDALLGFHAPGSRMIFPVIEGVPVLLPRRARRHQLEMQPVRAIEAAFALTHSAIAAACRETIAVLEANRDVQTWEWEDEAHWAEVYTRRLREGRMPDWTFRMRERRFLRDAVLRQTTLAGRVLLEIGCGEGQNFRELFEKHAANDTLYIATDISLAALRLNRTLTRHDNALYVLCTADDLPMADASIDVLSCIGVLHHTEHKAGTIARCRNAVKPGGLLVVSEAVERFHPSRLLPRFLRRSHQSSAHEERIPETSLWNELTGEMGWRVRARRRSWGILYAVMLRSLGVLMKRSPVLFWVVHAADRALIAGLGWLVPVFRPAIVDIVAVKSD